MATIETPLGGVELSITADCSSDDASSLSQCIAVFAYRPMIPPSMSVAGCYAALACITPQSSLRNLCFRAALRPAQVVKGGPETGECLDALGIYGDAHVLLIGTEDTDRLQSRLNGSVVFPKEPWPISEDSMTLHLLEAVAGRTLTLHFVVAWNGLPEPEDCSCWYAVDQEHALVLSAWRANHPMQWTRDNVRRDG